MAARKHKRDNSLAAAESQYHRKKPTILGSRKDEYASNGQLQNNTATAPQLLDSTIATPSHKSVNLGPEEQEQDTNCTSKRVVGTRDAHKPATNIRGSFETEPQDQDNTLRDAHVGTDAPTVLENLSGSQASKAQDETTVGMTDDTISQMMAEVTLQAKERQQSSKLRREEGGPGDIRRDIRKRLHEPNRSKGTAGFKEAQEKGGRLGSLGSSIRDMGTVQE
ncbi:MAG: hypothetical protein L6R39_000993 [Caloplaca ligustica]|nr:MAG: hypothetical protein L6R39_000993 [Caloplaca ligustica]